jgi:DNA-binding NarL/FixJ family response regulator
MTLRASKTNEIARSLSARELEVLRLLTQGHDIGTIGAQLGVSAKTVANHQSAIKDKLNVTNTLQLMFIARKLGLIEING